MSDKIIAAPENWTCPTCNVAVATAFCSSCGERPVGARELTVHGLTTLVYKAFSPVDGRLLRSFLALIAAPGRLTAAFQQGLRKPFVGPFQLFLMTNVLFFAVQSVSTLRIFTQPLTYRLHGQPGSEFGQTLVDARLAATGKTLAEYAPVFDQAVATNAKSLIGLRVPLLALLLPLVFWRRHRPLAVHVVFSLHFYTFLLILFCVPLIAIAINTLLGGPPDLKDTAYDAMSIGLLLSCAAYLYLAIAPVYGTRGVARIAQTLILTTAVVGIFMIYRFILLPITLYTT